MHFEFATATRIVFGEGLLKYLGEYASEMGQKALVVTGHTSERAIGLFDILKQKKIEYVKFCVSKEPTVETVRLCTQKAREELCDLVIGFGGGSPLDTGKAVAALLTNGGDPIDYLEIIGKGKQITKPPSPYIAIPTTAGTGSEVTRNAVIGSPEHKVKVSLRSALLLPKLALIDPTLTYTLPPETTASTGLDAFTQVLEPYVSNKPNPMTDIICREGIVLAARSLRKAYEHGDDAKAREDMSLVSLFGGIALANAKLGAVHGFAGPIGGMFAAPHGAVCARLLPHVMEVNVRAIKERDSRNSALVRYDQIARILTGSDNARAMDGVKWVQEVCDALAVPPLRNYGIGENDITLLVEKSAVSSSMKGNPITLTIEEMKEILLRAI